MSWGQMYRNVMSFIHVILSLMGSWSVARFIVLCFSLSIQKSKSITNPNAFLNHSFIDCWLANYNITARWHLDYLIDADWQGTCVNG